MSSMSKDALILSDDEWSALRQWLGPDDDGWLARLRRAPDSLDVPELEDALPEEWEPLIGREAEGGWWATASAPLVDRAFTIVSSSDDGTLYPTMAAAVHVLVAKLRDRRARE